MVGHSTTITIETQDEAAEEGITAEEDVAITVTIDVISRIREVDEVADVTIITIITTIEDLDIPAIDFRIREEVVEEEGRGAWIRTVPCWSS